MSNHPYNLHREHQVSHRRVNAILKDEPAGAKQHAAGSAFSKVTSKSAATSHDGGVRGDKSPKRFARGGKVRGHGHQTNIVIAVPKGQAAPTPPLPGQLAGPGGPPPGPAPSPMGGPPGMPPGAPPPGMPMRAKGGRVSSGKIDGESTKADIKKFARRAESNSYFRGGAATGVGREEKAAHMKRGK